MTAASWDRKRQRRGDLKRRIEEGRIDPRRCRIDGCSAMATAATGRGLNRRFCRRHEEHYERHGSYVRRSYSAAEVTPARRAALRWLKTYRDQPMVQRALLAVQSMCASAGPCENAYGLRGLPPAKRARAAWARLREAKVAPERVLAAWLAVELAIRCDPQPDLRDEFKRVQAAKLVHRMASGTHRRWERQTGAGATVSTELHKYPASRGRVLRHLGEQIERAAAPITDEFLQCSGR